MSQWAHFGIDPAIGWDKTLRIARVLLDKLRPHINYAWIDALTDHTHLSSEAQAAVQQLRRLDERRWAQQRRPLWGSRRKGPTYKGIDLNPRDPDQFALLRTFGPYSIHAEVYRANEKEPVLVLHDTGTSIHFRWKPEQLSELAAEARVSPSAFHPIT